MTPRPYRYRSIGEGATLGRGRGIARVFGLHVRGSLGALITRAYHVSAVPVRSRRLRILADGLLSTMFRRDIAQLGTSGRRRQSGGAGIRQACLAIGADCHAVSSARTMASSAVATSISASSSATRRMASAARVSASSSRRARVSPSASARSARLASALSLREALGGASLGRGQGDLELLDRGQVCGHLLLHAGDVGRVLVRTLGREVAVGLSLLGPVAVGVAAGLHELGVGDPDGGRTEGDAEEGGGREETPRTGQDGADDGDRREDDKGGSDRDAGTALPTTSLGGRHEVRLGGVLVLSDATRTLQEQRGGHHARPARWPR